MRNHKPEYLSVSKIGSNKLLDNRLSLSNPIQPPKLKHIPHAPVKYSPYDIVFRYYSINEGYKRDGIFQDGRDRDSKIIFCGIIFYIQLCFLPTIAYFLI